MTLGALIAALLIEQARALSAANPFHSAFRRYARFVELNFNSGRYRHGMLAWLFAVVPIVIAVSVAAAYLGRTVPVLAVAFNVAVLYLTMGFRQFSHAYGDTLDALRLGDIDRARTVMQGWVGRSVGGLPASELAGLAIERGLCNAHRHVFGVIAWFAVFGPGGAVLYRLGAILRDSWGERRSVEEAEFGAFSRTIFDWCDWVPARLTAVSFAVVGDFEDALYCWRTQAHNWTDGSQGVVLASGAGAIGVRLGAMLGLVEPVGSPSELGTGEDADSELMTSAVGLVWRALVLWLFVILVITAASWFG